ncbi:MAG: glutathione S-transferase N-terminal domain-containing protein [Pseudomonadota bacterium]
MKLYDSTGAPNPRRVRMFMAEKGVDCEKEEINIVKGENLTDAFLAVNPRGMLPTLVLDDGTALDETVAICRYIEEQHPEPPLMGTDAVSKAQVEARLVVNFIGPLENYGPLEVKGHFEDYGVMPSLPGNDLFGKVRLHLQSHWHKYVLADIGMRIRNAQMPKYGAT